MGNTLGTIQNGSVKYSDYGIYEYGLVIDTKGVITSKRYQKKDAETLRANIVSVTNLPKGCKGKKQTINMLNKILSHQTYINTLQELTKNSGTQESVYTATSEHDFS